MDHHVVRPPIVEARELIGQTTDEAECGGGEKGGTGLVLNGAAAALEAESVQERR
jgi:hypothetical protein